MNKRLLLCAALALTVSINANAEKKKKTATEKAEKPISVSVSNKSVQMNNFNDSLAYAIGNNIGSSFLRDDMKLNLDLVKSGMEAAVNQKEGALTKEDQEKIFKVFSEAMQVKQKAVAEKQEAQNKIEGDKNVAIGKKFLEENKTKPGVRTTASGLQFKVVSEGNGPKPTAADNVTVHYTGTLIDGTKFDSSVGKDPVTFPLGGVIKGWTEGLQLMNEGSKYTFYIPSELAYGDRGAGGIIGPNSVLVFDVELIKVDKKAETPNK